MEYYVSLFTETCKSRIVQYLLSCFSSLHTCFSAQSTRLKLLYSICRDEEQNHNDLGRAVPKKSKSTARLGVLSRPPLPPVPRCSRWSLPSPPASAAAHARPLRSGPKARLLFYLFGFWDLASGFPLFFIRPAHLLGSPCFWFPSLLLVWLVRPRRRARRTSSWGPDGTLR